MSPNIAINSNDSNAIKYNNNMHDNVNNVNVYKSVAMVPMYTSL